MFQKLFSFTINTLYLITIIFVVIMITTTTFMKKLNTLENVQQNQVIGKVVKEDSPMIATTAATLKEITVTDGQHVQNGDILFSYYQKSANDNLEVETVKSPAAGVIRRTSLQNGDAIQPEWKVMDIYQDNNPRLLTYVTEDQYNQIKKLNQLQAYSHRLDQAFTVTPKLLQADAQDTGDAQQKIGVYFEFIDIPQSVSLLNNEQLTLILPQPKAKTLTDMLGTISFLPKK